MAGDCDIAGRYPYGRGDMGLTTPFGTEFLKRGSGIRSFRCLGCHNMAPPGQDFWADGRAVLILLQFVLSARPAHSCTSADILGLRMVHASRLGMDRNLIGGDILSNILRIIDLPQVEE